MQEKPMTSPQVASTADVGACGCGATCGMPAVSSAPGPAPNAAGGTVFRIPTLDCAAEESEIRHALDGVAGVQSLNFQLSARTMEIHAPTGVLPQALEAIRRAGFDPQPVKSGGPDTHNQAPATEGLWRLGLALVLTVVAELLAFFVPDTMAFKLAGMALAATAIWLAGFSTYTKGLAALRQGRLNINALMTVAVTGAFLIGQWPEAAMVMALYAIAELIEARAVDRARNAIKSLLDLTPDTAEVRQPGGMWLPVPAAEVALDAIVRVKPGARIPLDGTVTSGTSAVNQAPVTGESLPVDKGVGDAVFAGTINETGTLEVRVTAAASNTTLARIIHAVEQAQGTRAVRRQIRRRLYPFGLCAGRGGGGPDALADGCELDAGAVQGAGHAGDRLSLRPRARHPRHRGQRSGCSRAAR